jgi:23S rRNA (adenine2030-N6)-methyltransferase
MGYIHYGRIGDVWKHLPLCSILKTEKPTLYIESNSASAEYTLAATPEQKYGIYHLFYEIDSEPIKNSDYLELIKKYNPDGVLQKYVGSAVQGFDLLCESGSKFIFYDLDRESLNKLEDYFSSINELDNIIFLNTDSISDIHKNIDKYDQNTFIHFDPYMTFEKNENNLSFADVFIECLEHGIKCFCWYGFMTRDQQLYIHNEIRKQISNKGITTDQFCGYDVYLNAITNDEITFNPGILGCGIMTGNLSQKSDLILKTYQNELLKVYRGIKYDENFDGSLGIDIWPL